MARTRSIAALLLAVLLVSGCWGSRSASHPTTTQESQRAKLGKLKQFHRYGITFEYPESWFVTTRPISSASDPAYRFTVSTVPVRRTPADRRFGDCAIRVINECEASWTAGFPINGENDLGGFANAGKMFA